VIAGDDHEVGPGCASSPCLMHEMDPAAYTGAGDTPDPAQPAQVMRRRERTRERPTVGALSGAVTAAVPGRAPSAELPAAAEQEKTSVLLARIVAELPGEEVLVGQLVRALRHRSFGGILILLSVLGLIPGISVLAGIAMLLPGVQMLTGLRAPLLPRYVRRRTVRREHLRAFAERALPVLERIERYVRPRWLRATRPPVQNLAGAVVVGLALVIMLPLPFSNFPPALALVCLALGLLERDGLVLSLGLVLSAIALAVGIAILWLAVRSVALLIGG